MGLSAGENVYFAVLA